MADADSELLAMMADVLRAVDHQTEENKKAIAEVGQRFEGVVNARREEFIGTFNNFAAATVDGFIRAEGKVDAVKEEVAGLRQDAQQINHCLARLKANQVVPEDVVRRLVVLENIVLNKAS